jgi:hypothetical protein
MTEDQQEWLDGESPADDWDAHATKRVLDDLFCFARQFHSSEFYEGPAEGHHPLPFLCPDQLNRGARQ